MQFKKNGIYGALFYGFNSSLFNAVNYVYLDRFKPWELNRVPSGSWTKENCIKATRWLIEDKLKLNFRQALKSVSIKDFENNGLGPMLQSHFRNSVTNASILAYPDDYKNNILDIL